MIQQTEIATRESREKLKSISAPKEIPFRAEFSAPDFERIKRGLIPISMEDKWFMFFEAGTLFLHRSWTGHCIYQINIKEQNNKWVSTSALVNRNPEEYNQSDDNYDVKLLRYLIDCLLLGKQMEFPIPETMSDKTKAGIYQHSVAGNNEMSSAKKTWWKFW